MHIHVYHVKMEAKMDQLRTLVEAADKEKVELLNQLEEEKRWGFRGVWGDKRPGGMGSYYGYNYVLMVEICVSKIISTVSQKENGGGRWSMRIQSPQWSVEFRT